MELSLAQWPLLSRVLWTAGTIAVAYGLGFVINAVVFPRLAQLARKTDSAWNDVVMGEFRRRIPFWSLLIGIWLSLGYWPMPPKWFVLGNNVVKALGILSVTIALAAVASRLIAVLGARSAQGAPVPALVRNIARMVILAVGLLAALHGLGVNITPALAALGVGGLAVALALQHPLSNLFAGIFVTVAGQIRIGDYVRLDGGVEGHIQDFNWHSTRIQAPSGSTIIVPNAKVSQAIVTNYSLPTHEVGMGIDVVVDFASDLTKVEQATMEVARTVMKDVMGGIPDFEPAIRPRELHGPRRAVHDGSARTQLWGSGAHPA